MSFRNVRPGVLLGTALLLIVGLVLAACGGGSTPTPAPQATATPAQPGQTPDPGAPTATPASDFDAAAYFRGKTVTITVGFTPGGGYDAYARLVAPYLPQHIPGQPRVIVQNMPGGGGLTAANYIYNAARKDGTAMGLTISSFYFSQFNQEAGVDFDVLRMPQLGSPVSDNVLVYMREDYIGDRDLQEWAADISSGALRKPFIAGTGVGATIHTRILAELVPGLDYEYVLGYPGQTEVRLAIRRGEADGASGSESSLLEQLADLVDSGELLVVNQTGLGDLSRDPKYGNAPTLSELARGNSFHEALVSAFVARSVVGRPFFLPPDVQPEVVAVLQQALWDTFNDERFLADAERSNRPVSPVTAQAAEQMFQEVFAVPENEAQQIRELLAE